MPQAIQRQLTRGEKIARLRSKQFTATTAAANIFAADVPQGVRRHIVGILISNADNSPVFLTVNLVEDDDTTTAWLDSMAVPAMDNWPNQDWPVKIDDPILVLTGQQNLEFDVDTATKELEITIWWYDELYV